MTRYIKSLELVLIGQNMNKPLVKFLRHLEVMQMRFDDFVIYSQSYMIAPGMLDEDSVSVPPIAGICLFGWDTRTILIFKANVYK